MEKERTEMAGCKKHHRMRSGGCFVDVTPEFFETHLNGILSTIQPTLCDACIREGEDASQEDSHSLEQYSRYSEPLG